MHRAIAAAVLLIATLLAAWPPTPADAQQPSCRFVLGFATLRDLIGSEKVGSCLEDEHFNIENGNAEQHTTGGLMVWRKVDNFTAFTDGATSWINGPNGLQTRPNGERFSWEKDPIQPARTQAAPAAAPASSSGGLPSAPTPTATAPASAPAPQRTTNTGPTATPQPTSTPDQAPVVGPTLVYPGNGGGPTTCNDGSISHSSGRGTCSGHGGIKR